MVLGKAIFYLLKGGYRFQEAAAGPKQFRVWDLVFSARTSG